MSHYSATNAVNGFFCAWAAQDWDLMSRYTQLTWLQGPIHGGSAWKVFWRRLKHWRWNAVKELAERFSDVRPTLWQIVSNRQQSAVMVDVRVYATLEIGGRQVSRHFVVRTIAERAAYQPDPMGRWGVNPISIWRENW